MQMYRRKRKMKNTRHTVRFCIVLLIMIFVYCSGQAVFAASASSSVSIDAEPVLEDFEGEYTCTTISFGENIVPLDEEEPYTLTIKGEEAVVTGLDELGKDPLKLQFEDGELFFIPPEEEERILTLRLQEDGLVTLTFDKIPEAPVFRFEPAEDGK